MSQFRVGIGYDVHRLARGRRLLLGGVEIPHDFGLLGHSDADVVLHAVTDALLGAIGEADIGDLFPDVDPAIKNADSRVFLKEALRRVHKKGYAVENVDVIVHAEAPKLSPFKIAIAACVAELLSIEPCAVCIKAKTNERLGPIGTGEAIACTAVVLVKKNSEFRK